jgi:hypothetical protein
MGWTMHNGVVHLLCVENGRTLEIKYIKHKYNKEDGFDNIKLLILLCYMPNEM